MSGISLTETQIQMMKHAWGWASRPPGYRTHYCCIVTHPDMLELVAKKMFNGPQGEGNFGAGHAMFHLSDEGIAFLERLKK